MNQLAKIIVENSKVLAEFGMAPPIISKIKNMIPMDISTTYTNSGNKKLTNYVKNESTESNLTLVLKCNIRKVLSFHLLTIETIVIMSMTIKINLQHMTMIQIEYFDIMN